jgi:hypothetical protein
MFATLVARDAAVDLFFTRSVGVAEANVFAQTTSAPFSAASPRLAPCEQQVL